MASAQITFGYWPFRGAAGAIQSMLEYLEIPYTEKKYTERDQWFGKDKEGLGFQFPNLPYIIDGDKKLTESGAILKYLPIRAGKKSLIGDTDDKLIQVEVALGVIADLSKEVGPLCFTKGDFNAAKEEAFTSGVIKKKLDVINKNLEGKEWITGFLSVADFKLYENIDLFTDIDKAKLESWPNVVAFHKRFSEIPQIKAFKQSERFRKIWFPPGIAAWAGAGAQ